MASYKDLIKEMESNNYKIWNKMIMIGLDNIKNVSALKEVDKNMEMRPIWGVDWRPVFSHDIIIFGLPN